MEKKSSHILNASSNLLGFSTLIVTSLKITKIGVGTYLDEFAAISSILFAFSSFFSFLSIRSKTDKRKNRLETIADYSFLIALFCLVSSVVIIMVEII